MAEVRIELNREGVRELLRSDEMMEICKKHADNALNKLGEGYEVSTHTGKNRVNAEIAAKSYAAKKENMENNTISIIFCNRFVNEY